MSIESVAPTLRTKPDVFHHIDMGFLNRRLCLTILPPKVRAWYQERIKPGSDHFSGLANDHLLVTVVLDYCRNAGAPTLLQALEEKKIPKLFCSTERLAPCPDVYEALRVRHAVELDVDFGKPIEIAYHTEHIVSSTGRMTLAEGAVAGYQESIVGLLHDKSQGYEIEPLIIGAPWYEHPRNGADADELSWLGQVFGEILPEDIDQFSSMKDVEAANTDEWMDTMRRVPEATVKLAFASILKEPAKKDWGGEANDHFSGSISVGGRRSTAAFLLKATPFREMTLEMCGKRADQIHRLVDSGAEISVVQHSHLVGPVVRRTLRNLTVQPGHPRRYCVIDGQATFRILKAHGFLADYAG